MTYVASRDAGAVEVGTWDGTTNIPDGGGAANGTRIHRGRHHLRFLAHGHLLRLPFSASTMALRLIRSA